MKRRIRLTESTLHRIIKESVRRILNESVTSHKWKERMAQCCGGKREIVDAFLNNLRCPLKDNANIWRKVYETFRNLCNTGFANEIEVTKRLENEIWYMLNGTTTPPDYRGEENRSNHEKPYNPDDPRSRRRLNLSHPYY